MVKATCLELSQADFKALGRSRGFEPETIASRELVRHVFLAEQGVLSAAASLTPAELAGLHLLHCLREPVDVEFFKRVYPAAVSPKVYASYNDRFKALFQEVKTRLIQRGLLVFGLLPDTFPRGRARSWSGGGFGSPRPLARCCLRLSARASSNRR